MEPEDVSMQIDWSLAPIFGNYWVVSIIGLLLVLGLLTLSESSSVSRWKRFVLWLLRALVIVTLLIAMLRPGLTFTKTGSPQGAIAVLLDTSTSMLLASQQSGRTRWDLEREIQQKLLASQTSLGKDTRFVFYGYDEQLRLLGDAQKLRLPDTPQGTSTDVGTCLAQVIASQTDPPLTAVVWLGDASQTATHAQVDPQQVAKQLAQLDIPLYVIGIGPRADLDQIRDLAVMGVPEQIDVFTKNEVKVLGTVHARGVANRRIPIQLGIRMDSGEYRRLAQDAVLPDLSDQSLPFRLPMTAPDPGSYEIRVNVASIDGETQTENNTATCFVNVREGGLRVLYLEGEPRVEQRFLRMSLNASQDFELDYLSIDRRTQRSWPKDLREQLSGVYDAYILGDLDSTALGNDNLKLLADRIKEGAGLITLGGYYAYGSGGYDKTPLRDVLPIEMPAGFRQVPGQPIQTKSHFSDDLLLRPTGIHEVVMLGSESDNRDKWKLLNPMPGANRFAGLKPLPGIQVLLQGPNREPMLVAGSFGEGRVLCAAFDSTYLWWRSGYSQEHRKFWRQAVHYVKRGKAQSNTIELKMSKRRLFRDQASDVEIIWRPHGANTAIPDNVQVKLFQILDSQQDKSIREQDLGGIALTKRDTTTWTGKVVAPNTPGRYELRAVAQDVPGSVLETKMPFIVLEQTLESMQPIPDWSLMSQMVRLNESAGGGMIDAKQIDPLIEKLVDQQLKSKVKQIQSMQLGQGVIDSWIAFLLIFLLFAAQWSLRKVWNLV